MSEQGLKVSREYVEFVYSYLMKVEELEENYSIERLSFLLRENPVFMKDTLSFMEYNAVGMIDYIVEDLRDYIDIINENKSELDSIEFLIEINKEDIDHFFESIKRSHKFYTPFIFENHVKMALLNNEKALMCVKAKALKDDAFFKAQLMSHIQYQLVGKPEPAPCAKNSTKHAYFELFKGLKKNK